MMRTTFFACGLNHETAPVAVREAFALTTSVRQRLYEDVVLSDDAEWMLVSTCNRTEAFLYGTPADLELIRQAMAQAAGRAFPAEHAFLLAGEEAVLHLLEVTSGVRSLIPGDAQIFSQVKQAYRMAVESDTVGTVLHRLLHTAFHGAKRVFHETNLMRGTASVPAAAVQAACTFLGAPHERPALAGKRVLVIGAGEVARLLLSILRSHEPAGVTLTNRSQAHAACLAAGSRITLVGWEDRYTALRDADVVFVATGAAVPVLTADAMPRPAPVERPRLLVDLAVPRNVDPAIDRLPGYHVVDLDRLGNNASDALTLRSTALPQAKEICRSELEEYLSWFGHHQQMQPFLRQVRSTFDAIRRQEIERHSHRLTGVDRAELDRLTASIMQKLLALPVVRLKSMSPASRDFEHGIRLLHALFTSPGCDEMPAHALAPDDDLHDRIPFLCAETDHGSQA